MKQFEEGRRIAALVVHHCGDKYFPLFDRFDREVEQRLTAAARLEAALSRLPAPPAGLHPQ
ncbi:hypothetical protein [Henriciella aquimarina]|uniref:hypothetical protein n=1 Tax=Henriciella aquimarina TaxID=545261 RepID=UPI0011799AEB|nr:hypothetical protein [Henriciella aquimarina]